MSTKKAISFLEKLQSDPSLLKQVQVANKQTVLSAATAEGCAFQPEHMKQALKEIREGQHKSLKIEPKLVDAVDADPASGIGAIALVQE